MKPQNSEFNFYIYILYNKSNVGFIHVFFHSLTFAGFRGSCLNKRPQGRVLKHLPRDPANVNAMKQMCDRYSCILPDSNLKSHKNAGKT